MASVAKITIFGAAAIAEARQIARAQLEDIAGQVAAAAKSSAPVESGEYRDGIGVETRGDKVYVVNNDDEAIYKEYGTVDTPAHATMTNAARQFGKYSGMTPRGGR